MTNAITPAVNNEQANAFMQSLSPEQMRILMGALSTPEVTADNLSVIVESLVNRLAGNGLTGDMANYWASQLLAVAGDSEPEIVKVANLLQRGGAVTAHAAVAIESDLRDWLSARKSQPVPTVVPDVIDTTAQPSTNTLLSGAPSV